MSLADRRSQPSAVSIRTVPSGERPGITGAAAVEFTDYVEEITLSGYPTDVPEPSGAAGLLVPVHHLDDVAV